MSLWGQSKSFENMRSYIRKRLHDNWIIFTGDHTLLELFEKKAYPPSEHENHYCELIMGAGIVGFGFLLGQRTFRAIGVLRNVTDLDHTLLVNLIGVNSDDSVLAEHYGYVEEDKDRAIEDVVDLITGKGQLRQGSLN